MHPRVAPRCAEIVLNLMSQMCHLRNRRLRLVHVLLMTIGWTPSPPHRRTSFDVLASNARNAATCPRKKKLRRNIVPHGENIRKTGVYKVGRNNALALPPQLSKQGPLTRGPSPASPLTLPRGATRASAWTRVVLPRVRATSMRGST